MATLFATTVSNAKPRESDYKLSDGGGLYLLVRPNGAKLWRLNYRFLEKHRTMAFGAWPDVMPAGAETRHGGYSPPASIRRTSKSLMRRAPALKRTTPSRL